MDDGAHRCADVDFVGLARTAITDSLSHKNSTHLEAHCRPQRYMYTATTIRKRTLNTIDIRHVKRLTMH